MKHSRRNKHLSWLAIVLICIFSAYQALAATTSSTNFSVQNPAVDQGFASSSSGSFGLGQSLGQVAIGKSTSTSFQIWSGFQYFFAANSNTLSAAAGNGQASLSWTVPQTFLGVTVGSYEVGAGTASGSYVYTNVGSATSYTATSLSNGTTYYFKVRAKTAGGIVLVYSNEASAIPTGAATSPSASGGGGGSNYTGKAIISGTAYPGATVYLLKDLEQIDRVTADHSGRFSFTVAGLATASYQFALYASDPNNLRSPLVVVPVNAAAGQSVTVNNILLPPTLTADKSEVKKGDDLILSGFAAPGGTVLIVFGKGSEEFVTALANLDGSYRYVLNTAKAQLGDFTAKAKVSYLDLVSNFSQTVAFIVGEKNVTAKPATVCGVKADFNDDCKVNLVDFSILAYWFLKPQVLARYDLNSDGAVDLIDISILLYYWTG